MGESNLSSNIKLGEPSEKPKVISVSRTIWKEAVKRVGEEGDGRKIALAEKKFPFRTLVISTPQDENFLADGRLKEIGRRGNNVDLVIKVTTKENDGKRGGQEMAITSNEIYYFSPGNEYKEKSVRGETTISHPDDEELHGLLDLVSSAKKPSLR